MVFPEQILCPSNVEHEMSHYNCIVSHRQSIAERHSLLKHFYMNIHLYSLAFIVVVFCRAQQRTIYAF